MHRDDANDVTRLRCRSTSRFHESVYSRKETDLQAPSKTSPVLVPALTPTERYVGTR